VDHGEAEGLEGFEELAERWRSVLPVIDEELM
jgi:hypothetical protein